MDATLQWMIENKIPLTRSNWLELNYLGNPPAEIDGELEAERPMDELIDDRVTTSKPAYAYAAGNSKHTYKLFGSQERLGALHRASSPDDDVNSINVTFEIHSSSVTPAAGAAIGQPQSELVFTTITGASLLNPARGFYAELPGRNGLPVLLGRDGNLPQSRGTKVTLDL